jgi:TRAP transporter TAXI family solute receptor
MTTGSSSEARAGRTWRERIAVVGPAMVIMVAGLVIAYQFIKPAPPRHIVFATGPEQGAYAYYGRLYRDRLQREGISVTTEITRGSIENIELLRDHRADIAFVQGGAAEDIEAPHLRSLASLYLEPIWIFVRKDASIGRLSELRGRRVALDKEGSGTRAVVLQLLADNHIREGDFIASSLGGGSAAQALHEGKVDAASFVIAPSAGVIQDLLAAPDVVLLGVNRAAAYRLRHRFLSVVTLPEGAADLARDVPSADITLLATTANLVIRDDFHPALAELLLRIAKEFHSEAGLFEEAGEFPSRKYLGYPISEDARRFFDAGPSLLQRYLPFWAANLIDRLKIMLLPLITLVYPLFKLIPPTYDWRMKSRINRWYKDLQAIEQGVQRQPTAEELKRCLVELDRIERIVQRLSMPVSYANPLYTLRLHIALLRGEIREALEHRVGRHGLEQSSAG